MAGEVERSRSVGPVVGSEGIAYHFRSGELVALLRQEQRNPVTTSDGTAGRAAAPWHPCRADTRRSIFSGGVSHAQPRPRRSRRRLQRGKGGAVLGTVGSTSSGRARGSVSPAVAT